MSARDRAGFASAEAPRSSSPHPLDVKDGVAIIELVVTRFGCAGAALSTLSGDRHEIFATAGARPLDADQHAQLVRSVTSTGAIVRAECASDPGVLWIGVPLRSNGAEVVGVLSLATGTGQLSVGDEAALSHLQVVINSLLEANEARQIAAERQAELSLTLEYMDQAITVFDADARLTFWNQRYVEIFSIDETVAQKGASLRDIIASQSRSNGFEGFNTHDYDVMLAQLRAGLARGETVEGGVRLANGRIISSIHTAMPDGGWIATHSDVTERVLAQEKVEHASLHDPMTGLANRTKFTRDFYELSKAGYSQAILLIDIDHFKSVNDNFGHAAGDATILAVADRLSRCVEADDIVARLGGDEFAVLLKLDPADAGRRTQRVADAILNRMRDAVCHDNAHIDFSVSIGAHVVAKGDSDLEAALSRADFALYKAKEYGRGRMQRFTCLLADEMARDRLSSALVTCETYDEKLCLFFQPIVCLATTVDRSFEALIRWAGAEGEYLSPTGIIEAAEQNGAIGSLGDWVLNEALCVFQSWGPEARLAVNISPRQLGSGLLVNQVKFALERFDVAPHRLELEVTEAAILQDIASMRELHDLKKLGVQIALDDFGTGYSSRTLLQQFPFDRLKIDPSFVSRVDTDPLSHAIVKSVVTLGRDLDVRTVAEGIETQRQLETMADLGCDLGQGFLLGRPAPAAHMLSRARRAGFAA